MESGEAGASVFHLHGRATLDDSLVITEHDYMQLYLTDDRNRPTIDEGIQAAFSGAPLLFLGLGMEETDLLRPLRQFISNRDRTIGYTSMALLPAEKGFAARTKFTAALYMRYGVHTIFYGSGQLTYQSEPGGKNEKTYAIDWLHRVLGLTNGLRAEVDKWEDGKAGGRTPAGILSDLIKAVGTVGPDMAEELDPPDEAGGSLHRQDTSALCVLLNWPSIDADDEAALSELADHLSAPSRAAADKTDRPSPLRTCAFAPTRPSEYRLAHREESETRIEGEKYLGFYTRQLDRLMAMVLQLPGELDGEDGPANKPHCAPIRIALEGLYGSVLSDNQQSVPIPPYLFGWKTVHWTLFSIRLHSSGNTSVQSHQSDGSHPDVACLVPSEPQPAVAS
ncbi:hypothetical protein CFI11_19115 [Thalassococcus sp. S3]|nr:hypothetical protein CFI11_19115 [Thalassococcus sp. S3]